MEGRDHDYPRTTAGIAPAEAPTLSSPASRRAVGYVRVSTDRQGDSVELQTARIRAYCTMRGLELVEIVEDTAVSGSTPLAKRPGGRTLATALKLHGAENVVALKLDRLFRNCHDALGQTEAWDRARIALHLIDMGGGSVDSLSPSGRLMLTMLAGFSEFERRIIGERTRGALARKRELGFLTGSVPYGWKLRPDWRALDAKDPERKRLYRHEAEQTVIALVHELHAAGQVRGPGRRRAAGSLRSIAAELATRGILTRTGRPFGAEQVARILAGPPAAAPEVLPRAA